MKTLYYCHVREQYIPIKMLNYEDCTGVWFSGTQCHNLEIIEWEI